MLHEQVTRLVLWSVQHTSWVQAIYQDILSVWCSSPTAVSETSIIINDDNERSLLSLVVIPECRRGRVVAFKFFHFVFHWACSGVDVKPKGKVECKNCVLIRFSEFVSLSKSTEDVIITSPHLSCYRGSYKSFMR